MASSIASHPHVAAAINLLTERFESVNHDGQAAYAQSLTTPGDDQDDARLRQGATAVVRALLAAYRDATTSG